jgi:hypothetical protein
LIKRLRGWAIYSCSTVKKSPDSLKHALSCSFQERAYHQPNQVKEKNMKNLRKLGASVFLTFALGAAVMAGEIPTPPCAPAPGQIDTPPCAAASADLGTANSSSTTSAGLNTPAVAQETSFSQIAANVLLNLLPLF